MEKGTGLGLSTVYGIVKQNNGFIWVYSEPEIGTTMKIYFPAVLSPDKKEKSEIKRAALKRGKGKILLIEDDEKVLKLTKRILESNGYSVTSYSLPLDALKQIRSKYNKFDLMISDVIMPQMNGLDLADKIRKYNAEMKTIFMSGYTGDSLKLHGLSLSVINFIQKPFSPSELLAYVKKILNDQEI